MSKIWLTMAEYARRNGISRPAVLKAVQTGRVESNGKTGRECRVRGPLAEPVHAVMPKIAPARQMSDLSEAKLAKLQADAKLQEQRLKETQELQWRQFADAVCEDYMESFATLPALLTEMRLPAPKLAALRKRVEECTTEFLSRMRRRWEKHESEDD